jgi:hypothetical protein
MKKITYFCLIANIIFVIIGLYKLFTCDYSHGLFLILINGFSLVLNIDTLADLLHG